MYEVVEIRDDHVPPSPDDRWASWPRHSFLSQASTKWGEEEEEASIPSISHLVLLSDWSQPFFFFAPSFLGKKREEKKIRKKRDHMRRLRGKVGRAGERRSKRSHPLGPQCRPEAGLVAASFILRQIFCKFFSLILFFVRSRRPTT